MTIARTLAAAIAAVGVLAGAASAQQSAPSAEGASAERPPAASAEPGRAALEAGEQLSIPPGPQDGMGAYVVAGFRSNDDWQFVMGPRESLRMGLRLVRLTEEGGAAFQCQREGGGMTMGLSIRGYRAERGRKLDMLVGVGESRHPLPMEARAETPEGEDTVFEATGQAVADILSAMGMADPNQWVELTFQAERGRLARLAVPDPRAISKAAAMVCDGWARLAAMPRVQDGSGASLSLPGTN